MPVTSPVQRPLTRELHEQWQTRGATEAQVRDCCDPELLRLAADGTYAAVVTAAYANPHLPQDVVDDAVHQYLANHRPSKDEYSWRTTVLAGIARRPDNRPEHWTMLRNAGPRSIQTALASNPRTPIPVLRSLTRITNQQVREALFSNPGWLFPDALAHALRLLSKPGALGVGRYGQADKHAVTAFTGLARRPLTDEQARELITAIGNVGDRQAAAYQEENQWNRDQGPLPRFLTLIVPVRASLHDGAARLYSPLLSEAITRLSAAPDLYADNHTHWLNLIHETVRSYRNIPGDVIDSTARSLVQYSKTAVIGVQDVMRRLLHHPSCPQSLLVELCGSDQAWLRRVAATSPVCPEEGRVLFALQDLAVAVP